MAQLLVILLDWWWDLLLGVVLVHVFDYQVTVIWMVLMSVILMAILLEGLLDTLKALMMVDQLEFLMDF